MAAPPATKQQAARRPTAKAGKKSQPPKTRLRSPPPSDNHPVKAMVIHRVPSQRPLADLMQEMGAKAIMGARWLFGGMRRLGKATSSMVIFFDKRLALGSHPRVKELWLPIEASDFDRGKRRLECSDW